MGRKRGAVVVLAFVLLATLLLSVQASTTSLFSSLDSSLSNDVLTLSTTLLDGDSTPLSQQTVQFDVQGTAITASTDADGVVTITLAKQDTWPSVIQVSLTHLATTHTGIPLFTTLDLDQLSTHGRGTSENDNPNPIGSTQTSNSVVPPAFSPTQRSAAFDDECSGAICKRRLYSGVANVYRDGQFIPIDTTFESIDPLLGAKRFENRDNVFETTIKEDAQSNDVVKVTLGSMSLSFDFVDALSVDGQAQNNEVSFEDVYADVDVHYGLYAGMLKESIILKSVNTQRSFTYRLDVRGVEPQLEADGSIGFYQSNTQRLIWTLPAPFMTDADYVNEVATPDSISFDVRYVLRSRLGSWYLDVVAEDAWLNAATYPVIVDPTVQLQDADTQNLGDTFAFENATASNANHNSVSLFTGSGFNGPIGSYLRFNVSSFLNLNRSIISAHLVLYHLGDSANNSGQNYSVFNITNQSWSESGCYNLTNCPALDSLINVTTADGPAHTNYSQRFDVTSYITQAIEADGVENVSFFVNRTFNASLNPDFDRFASKEFPDITRRPILEIEFFEQCSPELFWYIDEEVLCQNLDINASLVILDHNGTLVLQNTTLAVMNVTDVNYLNGSLRLESGSSIIFNSDVVLEGSMSLSDSQFRSNNTVSGKNFLRAENGSRVIIQNGSNLTNGPSNPNNGYSAAFLAGSRLTLEDSFVTQVGAPSPDLLSKGMYVQMNNSEFSIDNVTFYSNVTGSALLVLWNDTISRTLSNNYFIQDGEHGYGVVLQGGSNVVLSYNNISNGLNASVGGNDSIGLIMGRGDTRFDTLTGSSNFSRTLSGMTATFGNDTVYVFGGARSDGLVSTDLFRFEANGSWTNLSPIVQPPGRKFARLARLAETNRSIMFGGSHGDVILNGTWELNTENASWTNLTFADEIPTPRFGHSFAYDSQNDQFILYGGSLDLVESTLSLETWLYDPNTLAWTRRTPGSNPGARVFQGYSFDPANNRLYVFGGKDPSGVVNGETWTYDPDLGGQGTWSELTPVTSPPAREGAVMYYDPTIEKTVLFGGKSGSIFFSDIWTFDAIGAQWENITNLTSAFNYFNRSYAAYAQDTFNRKVYLMGGNDSGRFFDSTVLFAENRTEYVVQGSQFTNAYINGSGTNATGLLLENIGGVEIRDVHIIQGGEETIGVDARNGSGQNRMYNATVNSSLYGLVVRNGSNLLWEGGSIDLQSSSGNHLLALGPRNVNVTSVAIIDPNSATQAKVESGVLNLYNTSVTRGQTNVTGGQLDVYWFLDVYVKNRRQGVNNSNVSIFNNTVGNNQLLSLVQTDSLGFIARQSLVGYKQFATTTSVDENFTLMVNFTSVGESRDVIMSQSRVETFTLVFPCSPPSSGTWVPLPYEFCFNTSIAINGSIDIRPLTNLDFENVTLTINAGGSNGERFINNSNFFRVNRSTIQSSTSSGSGNFVWHNLASSVLHVQDSTITNFGIDDSTYPYENSGIFIRDSQELVLVNNSVTVDANNDNTRAFYLLEVEDSVIDSNTITISSPTTNVLSGGAAGIFLGNSSQYNSIENNEIIVGSSAGTVAIVVEESLRNNVSNNEINSSATSSKVIFFELGKYHLITNNTVRATGFNTDGILLSSSSSHNQVYNNSIITSARFNDALHIISNSKNNSIQDNIFLTQSDDSHALYIESGSNQLFVRNNSIKTTGPGGVGLYLDSITNITVIYNEINTTGSASSLPFGAHGVYATASSDGFFDSNTVWTYGTSSFALYLYYSNDMFFFNTPFNSTNADAIVLEGSDRNMYDHSFIGSSVGGFPILYLKNVSHTTLSHNATFGQIFIVDSDNISIVNFSVANAYNFNLIFVENSTFYDVNVSNASGRGLVVDYSRNNTFFNSFFEGDGNDVFVREESTVTLVNSTYTESDVGFGSDVTPSFPPGYLEKAWHVTALVNDSESGAVLANASLDIRDILVDLNQIALTNLSGRITPTFLSEFRQNNSATVYLNNYTINISKQEYFPTSLSINVSNNTDLVISLIYALSNIELNASISSSKIYAQNFTFNGSFFDTDFTALNFEIYKDSWLANATYDWVNQENSTPGNRSRVAMAYHGEEKLTYLFGGRVTSPSSQFFNETWSYNTTSGLWTQISTVNAPSPRAGAQMVYDPPSRSLVLFGGQNSTSVANDTWYFNTSNASWVPVTAITPPTNRSEFNFVYEADLGRSILLGGFSLGALNDTWAYNFSNSTWSNLSPSGDALPLTRQPLMTYDSRRNVVTMFGGYDGVIANAVDLTYDYNATENNWTLRAFSQSPDARFGGRMEYDALNERILLFGGFSASSSVLADTWTLNTTDSTWIEISPSTSPDARLDHGSSFDTETNQMLILGGNSGATFFNATSVLNFSRVFFLENRTYWTNGSLSSRAVLTNSSVLGRLITVTDEFDVTITLVEGIINSSLLGAPQGGRTVLNISELISLGIISSKFEEANGSVNTTLFPGSVLNITDQISQGLFSKTTRVITDITNTSFNRSYEGIILPEGSWTLDLATSDTQNRNVTRTINFTSHPAIRQTLLSGNLTGFVNETNATFLFNVQTKSYNKAKFYLNLSLYNSSFSFDTSFMDIGNDSLNTVSVGSNPLYAGAGILNVTNTTSADVPADIRFIEGLYNDVFTLYLTPYEGMSAGTYVGNFGWGLSDATN